MFGIARQQSDRTFLCIVFDLIRLGIVFQYYIWSQRVTCSELSEPAEKTNSQSNEARASELIWAAAGRLTARDSSDHGEWRDGATEGLAGLEGLSAGHPALPQSRPDPSLLLRPNIRGARLGRDSPGEFIMFIFTVYIVSTLQSPHCQQCFMMSHRAATQSWTITRFKSFFYLSDWSLQFHWAPAPGVLKMLPALVLNVKTSIWINLVSMTETP